MEIKQNQNKTEVMFLRDCEGSIKVGIEVFIETSNLSIGIKLRSSSTIAEEKPSDNMHPLTLQVGEICIYLCLTFVGRYSIVSPGISTEIMPIVEPRVIYSEEIPVIIFSQSNRICSCRWCCCICTTR